MIHNLRNIYTLKIVYAASPLFRIYQCSTSIYPSDNFLPRRLTWRSWQVPLCDSVLFSLGVIEA